MGDLISRQALLEEYDRLHVGEPGRARKMIEDAPSVQPEKRTEERTETHACDLISRQAAIDALKNQMSDRNDLYNIPVRRSIVILEQLPSAQPERLTDDDFETIRIHLNAYKEKLCNQQRWKEADEYQRIIDRFMTFASAQPERKTGKWTIYDRHTMPYQYICSECGAYHRAMYDFCPSCGADMREKHERLN